MTHNEIDQREIYNVKTMRMFTDYMKETLIYEHRKIEKILQEWGVDFEYLNNDENWFSQDVADKINTVMVRETGDADIAYKVGGEFSKKTPLSVHLLKSFLTPNAVFKKIQQSAAMYTKGSYYEVVNVSKNAAIIRSVVKKGFNEKPYQCRNRAGILKEIPVLFGCESAAIKENECFHRGGRYCEYQIDWINPKKTKIIGLFLLRCALYGATSFFLFGHILLSEFKDNTLPICLSIFLVC